MGYATTLVSTSLNTRRLGDFVSHSSIETTFLSPGAFKGFAGFPSCEFPMFGMCSYAMFSNYGGSIRRRPAISPTPRVTAVVCSSNAAHHTTKVVRARSSLVGAARVALGIRRLIRASHCLTVVPGDRVCNIVYLILKPRVVKTSMRCVRALNTRTVLGTFGRCGPAILSTMPGICRLFVTRVLHGVGRGPIATLVFGAFCPVYRGTHHGGNGLLNGGVFGDVRGNFKNDLHILYSTNTPVGGRITSFCCTTKFGVVVACNTSRAGVPAVNGAPRSVAASAYNIPCPTVSLGVDSRNRVLVGSPCVVMNCFHSRRTAGRTFSGSN